jgi:cyclic peptide transporter
MSYHFLRHILLIPLVLACTCVQTAYGATQLDPDTRNKIDEEVTRLMAKGEIPGLSLIVSHQGQVYIRHFGYADPESKTKVTAQTTFEVGSCTKAFTALALLELEQKGLIDLDGPVSRYLPWFYTRYKDSTVAITLRQLMHHTSGIPANALSQIPEGNGQEALTNTVKEIAGITLDDLPGTKYAYSSINYDVLGLVIEETTREPFESYVQDHILKPLGMLHSSIGYVGKKPGMAQGHKISFFDPRPYVPPVFRGNNPAGYLITNANDWARWLQFQLGLLKTGTALDGLVTPSHERDATVAVDRNSLSSYAAGWEVFLDGTGTIAHSGLNPSFSAFTGFIPGKQLGVGILANSNSAFTSVIGDHTLKTLLKEPIPTTLPEGGLDQDFSIVTFGLAIYVIAVLGYMLLRLYSVRRGTSRLVRTSRRTAFRIAGALLPLSLLLLGIYLLPNALAGFSWEAALVWAPLSFVSMAGVLAAALLLSYLAYILSLLWPGGDKYINATPRLLVLSLASGLSNAGIIILITHSVSTVATEGNSDSTVYLFFYFAITFFIYIFGRKVVQTDMVRLTLDLIHDVRMQLFNKIFQSSYQDFERIDKGKIYATLNNDTEAIGNTANLLVGLITSLVTAITVFVYLLAISFQASVVTILAIIAISFVYYSVSKKCIVLFESVRDTTNQYLELINGMVDGFKELSIHAATRLGYKRDFQDVNDQFRDKHTAARVGYVNAFLVGESLMVLILAFIAFTFPVIFPGMPRGTVLNYVVVMLYLIGPINNILSSIPGLMQIRVSWKRIHAFMGEIHENGHARESTHLSNRTANSVEHLAVEGLKYRYREDPDKDGFEVGPIEFELTKGKVVFVTGGNGSGKTTLSKLLTGLYSATGGSIKIDGNPVEAKYLGEYFSVVFNPFHLFKKIYTFNAKDSQERIESYFKVLGLSGKVRITDNQYSTIDLSQGQKKRLALLQCYLEDRPIFLFDEWAADQDPDYRQFFYKTLIPEMKRKGKIIIVITHDDQYFGEADQILKLTQGQQELCVEPDRLIQPSPFPS